MPPGDVSVVIATYQRRESCRAAVESALGQTRPPLEVIVADDGSTDGTGGMLREWAREVPGLRVLACERAGRPAPPRNRALAEARGTWVAFLDDDDQWLPHKLADQAPHLTADNDVVAANAMVGDRPYFPDPPEIARPGRSEFLAGNPIILSTAVARRDLLIRAGGFPEERWMRGIEDYALWLAAADLGARTAILGAPLARYGQQDGERLSGRTTVNQLAVARLFWRRWRAVPDDPDLRRAALSKGRYAITVARQGLLGR